MKSSIYYVSFFFLALAGPASATIHKLADTDRSALIQQASSVKMLHSMKDFPAPVIEACRSVVSDHKCSLADPDDEYQVTDVIMKEGLPRRHLLWGAYIPGYYILHYEAGGVGHSFHVIVFSFDGAERAKVVWKGVSHESFKDYSTFLDALKSGTLDDTQEYYF